MQTWVLHDTRLALLVLTQSYISSYTSCTYAKSQAKAAVPQLTERNILCFARCESPIWLQPSHPHVIVICTLTTAGPFRRLGI